MNHTPILPFPIYIMTNNEICPHLYPYMVYLGVGVGGQLWMPFSTGHALSASLHALSTFMKLMCYYIPLSLVNKLPLTHFFFLLSDIRNVYGPFPYKINAILRKLRDKILTSHNLFYY